MRSLHALRLVEMTRGEALSRDDKGGKRLVAVTGVIGVGVDHWRCIIVVIVATTTAL